MRIFIEYCWKVKRTIENHRRIELQRLSIKYKALKKTIETRLILRFLESFQQNNNKKGPGEKTREPTTGNLREKRELQRSM